MVISDPDSEIGLRNYMARWSKVVAGYIIDEFVTIPLSQLLYRIM